MASLFLGSLVAGSLQPARYPREPRYLYVLTLLSGEPFPFGLRLGEVAAFSVLNRRPYSQGLVISEGHILERLFRKSLLGSVWCIHSWYLVMVSIGVLPANDY